MSDDLEGADIWGESAGNNNVGNDVANDTSNNETLNANESEPTQEDDILDDETRNMSTSELRQRIMLLDNDIRVMKSDVQRIAHESRAQKERIRENMEKVKMNKQLPYLVGNVIEVLEPEAEDGKNISCGLHSIVMLSCVLQYIFTNIFFYISNLNVIRH
jgi:ATP-dependent 26S proteasome regulatory subunit